MTSANFLAYFHLVSLVHIWQLIYTIKYHKTSSAFWPPLPPRVQTSYMEACALVMSPLSTSKMHCFAHALRAGRQVFFCTVTKQGSVCVSYTQGMTNFCVDHRCRLRGLEVTQVQNSEFHDSFSDRISKLCNRTSK